MTKKKLTVTAGLLLLCAGAAAGIFCFAGSKNAYPAQTFYATVSKIEGNNLTVQGMDENDVNYRGAYWFPVSEETEITWRNKDISIEDLDVGDNISVSFTGEIFETYPAKIRQVEAIRLLEDEL
ncbi:DUF3221 domain-containing protein [Ruminococcus sp. CLA-AA-H200]|uniref:DUF3221 domain-containing protein n=1 Tax=Ruminococcus turbiniformis TaxID=2881258 RepID=A0ABS8FXH6_9FIRM|nr:DUF3221 domain-containing protein [Ruminococcus turbiniformis]MCC2253424.1 DUF3221 domain-containing protein [Ruminococcus turbiniformis]